MICTSNNCSNIFEEFAGSSEFTIFTRFIKQAGLVDYLKNTENLIVFVPNNAAFNKLDKAIINALKNPENYQILSNILKFHITFGKILHLLKFKMPILNFNLIIKIMFYNFYISLFWMFF